MSAGEPVQVADLFGATGAFDELGLEAPVYWPGIRGNDAPAEWAELRAWVQRLVIRYELDSHVVPNCWYRHNHVVEALAALRDHERGCFSPTAPPTGAIDWQRAWRDTEARLRAWIGDLRCDKEHHPAHDMVRNLPDDGWEAWVTGDRTRRSEVGHPPRNL